MADINPKSTQGAKKAITTRLRKLPLAKSEAQRRQLQEEISHCVDFLYKKAKKAEKATKILEEE